MSDAIASLERALALDRTHANAHFYLGRIYLEERRYDEAVASLERAVDHAPHMLAARASLAEARKASGTRPGGCGCAPRAGGLARRTDMALGAVFPAALLLAPHAVRIVRRRRRRN